MAKYGDERAERENGYIEYDYGPIFATNDVTGKRVLLNQPLDPHFQERQNVKLALKLAGSKTIRNVIKIKRYTDKQKRILKIFDIFLSIDDCKYRTLLKTFENNLSEIEMASRNNKGTKNLVKLIAACIVKNGSLFRIDITTHDIEYEILKIGKELDLKGFRDFDRSNFNDFLDLAANMKFYQVKKKLFCEENGLNEKYNRPEFKKRIMRVPDRLITLDTSKFVAQRYVSELFNKGIVKNSILINKLISEIELHYNEFFKLSQNISKVTAIIAIRLFNKEMKIPSLVKHLLSIDNLSLDVQLKEKIEGQCRLEERRSKYNDETAYIKDHIKSGYIHTLYRELEKQVDQFVTKNKRSNDTDVDQSSELEICQIGITVFQSKYYEQQIEGSQFKPSCPIITSLYLIKFVYYSNFLVKLVYSPIVTKYNHNTYFNKKDG